MFLVAWFQATGAAVLTTSTTNGTATVGYTEISTTVAGFQVDVSFEEVGASRVLGLAHYYASEDAAHAAGIEDVAEESEIGWHQAYATQGGTLVWDSTTGVTVAANAYGTGSNAYYRVFKVKVVPHADLTADQAANVPTKHTIGGSVTISDNCDGTSGTNDHNCAMIWSKASAIAADNTAVPEANLGTSALAFADIDLSSWFNGSAGSKAALYSTTFFAVMVDGAVHNTNTAITATLGWSGVDTK